MSTSFKIIEHTIPGQHIREYPSALRTRQEDIVRLAVKQYIPQQQPEPIAGNAITIIGTHGNGFPKEAYEPFMAVLVDRLKAQGVCVRAIWMADCSHQGASGVLNEQILGDAPNWFDHSRDLLHMINSFRDEMPQPLVGIAHSFSCAQMIHLSTMHPRLLSTLILCEPVILENHLPGPNPGLLSVLRRDLWKSRGEAEAKLRKAFKKWHPRALDLYLQHGLRELPTSIYDTHEGTEAVTLTTTKHMEAWTFAQIKFDSQSEMDRLLRSDQDPDLELKYISARPECMIAFRELPHVRPSVLYVFGGKSPLSPPSEIENKKRVTGTGVGGSGGAKAGKVQTAVLANAGHLLPFENVDDFAKVSAEWLGRWFGEWHVEEELIREYKNLGSDGTMQRMSQEYVAAVKINPATLRPLKLAKKDKGKL